MANPFTGTNVAARIFMYGAPAFMGFFEAYLRISHHLEEKWQFIPISATIGAFGLGIPLMLRAAPPTEPRPIRQNAGAAAKAEHALRAAEYKRLLGWHRCEGMLAGAAIATSLMGFVWWFHLLALQMDDAWATALKGTLLSDPVFAMRSSVGYYLMMCLATELKSWGAE